MDIQACYKIGYIAKNHGLKGEVTAVLNEYPGETLTMVFLEIDHSLVPYFIKKLSGSESKAVIAFEDVDTLEAASRLKGCSIYLPKSSRPKLNRGEFYDDEIIDFAVEDKTAGGLGKVAGIIDSGGNKLISVLNGEREILIPVNGPFIQSITRSSKKIKVDLPEGFLDI